MIVSLGPDCMYCGRRPPAYDTDTGAVLLEPDGARQVLCPHLLYGHYLSTRCVVDFTYLHPGAPRSDEVLEFLADNAYEGSLPGDLAGGWDVRQAAGSWDVRQAEVVIRDWRRLPFGIVAGDDGATITTTVPQNLTINVFAIWSSDPVALGRDIAAFIETRKRAG